MNKALNLARSDVLTFHEYDGKELSRSLARAKKEASGRPVICTEYMAREIGTTFQRSLPEFFENNVGCISWGLVAGRSQTHFNWATVSRIDPLGLGGPRGNASSVQIEYLEDTDQIPEPDKWFHDIFRMNGSAYDESEVQFIRNMTAKRFLGPPSEAEAAATAAVSSHLRRRLLADEDYDEANFEESPPSSLEGNNEPICEGFSCLDSSDSDANEYKAADIENIKNKMVRAQ